VDARLLAVRRRPPAADGRYLTPVIHDGLECRSLLILA
jgi:hypothetical protein